MMENTFTQAIRYKNPIQAAEELLRFSDRRLFDVTDFIESKYDEVMREYKYWSNLKEPSLNWFHKMIYRKSRYDEILSKRMKERTKKLKKEAEKCIYWMTLEREFYKRYYKKDEQKTPNVEPQSKTLHVFSEGYQKELNAAATRIRNALRKEAENLTANNNNIVCYEAVSELCDFNLSESDKKTLSSSIWSEINNNIYINLSEIWRVDELRVVVDYTKKDW